jgi:Helix-turn-helix domain
MKALIERMYRTLENLFSVSHEKEINLADGETTSQVYVRVYTSLFTSGLVANMGANRFTTLMALAAYMDENGECYPTQLQLASAIGVHKNTINKYINELLDFKIGGKHLVTRKKVNKGQGKIFSYYKIHPLSQLAKFGGTIEQIECPSNSDSLITSKVPTNCAEIRSNNNHSNNIKKGKRPINSREAIQLFQNIYRDTYNVNYTVSNYGREGKLIKDKVLTPFPEQAEDLIRLAIEKYDELFKKPNYPRPTIAMFSWAVNQLIPFLEEEKEQEEIAEQAADNEAAAEQAMLEKLAKLNGGNE